MRRQEPFPDDEEGFANMVGINGGRTELFVKILVNNCQSIAKAMLEDGSIKDEQYLQVLMEHLYLFIHIGDRIAYSIMGDEHRNVLLPRIAELSITTVIEATCGTWPDDTKAKIRRECMENLFGAMEEFSQYKRVMGDSETTEEDSLLWEFCKNIARIRGAESNPGAIIGHHWVVVTALENIKLKSHLEALNTE